MADERFHDDSLSQNSAESIKYFNAKKIFYIHCKNILYLLQKKLSTCKVFILNVTEWRSGAGAEVEIHKT